MTILFYTAIHLLGILFVLPLARKIPVWFLASSGFVWGILAWIAGSLFSAVLGLTYSWLSMGIILLPLLGIAIYFNIARNTIQLNSREWMMIGLSMISVAAAAYLVTRSGYVYATTDTFNYIIHGKILAKSGLTPWVINNFTKLGAFSSIFQMTSRLLPGEYLSGYQTILGLILIELFFVSSLIILKKSFSWLISVFLSGVLTLTLLSVTFQEHIFYIHNNLPAGLLFFISLYTFWKYYQSEEPEWLFLGLGSLIGFSFTRIEGPLYAVAILIFVITMKPMGYKRTLSLVLPYAIPTLAWHVFLYNTVIQNQQLSRTNLLLIIAAVAGLTILALGSKWIPELLPKIPPYLISVLLTGVILAVIVEPDHMITSISHFWQNLLNIYYWGWSWIAAAAAFPLLLISRKETKNRLLLYVISAYILIILLLALARIPYRIGKTDSANRLMLQALPMFYFAIASSAKALAKRNK